MASEYMTLQEVFKKVAYEEVKSVDIKALGL